MAVTGRRAISLREPEHQQRHPRCPRPLRFSPSTFLGYPNRSPLLTITTGRSLLVTLTLPERLGAGHVEFARQPLIDTHQERRVTNTSQVNLVSGARQTGPDYSAGPG